MCCGFGVKARAGREKLVRLGGREFFVKRGRLAARIPPQSSVTLPNHCALCFSLTIVVHMTISSNATLLRVPFGLRDSRLFEPLAVEPGIGCNCICPGCGAKLVAKHSPSGKVRPHFSHASETACNGGLESALHLAAKQFIEARHELYLPDLFATMSASGPGGSQLSRSACVREGELVVLLQVGTEVTIGSIRPDLVVNTADQKFLVEIAYTSFVNPEKLEVIRLQGKAAIEVDISDITLLNFEEIGKRLFEPHPKTTWLFHPELAARQSELDKLLHQDVARAQLDWARAQLSLQAAEHRKEARWLVRLQARVNLEKENHARQMEIQAQAALEKQKKVRQLDARTAEFVKLTNGQKLSTALKSLGVDRTSIETFLPISVGRVTGINAEHLVWQASVFSALISRALRRSEANLNVPHVCLWLTTHFTLNADSALLSTTVFDYLCGLAALQILHRMRGQNFTVAVPDILSAIEVANDVKKGQSKELFWREDWPSGKKATSVANVFATIYGDPYGWNKLRIALAPASVRDKEKPADIVTRYQFSDQGAMDARVLRRFLLSAGFVYVNRY